MWGGADKSYAPDRPCTRPATRATGSPEGTSARADDSRESRIRAQKPATDTSRSDLRHLPSQSWPVRRTIATQDPDPIPQSDCFWKRSARVSFEDRGTASGDAGIRASRLGVFVAAGLRPCRLLRAPFASTRSRPSRRVQVAVAISAEGFRRRDTGQVADVQCSLTFARGSQGLADGESRVQGVVSQWLHRSAIFA